MVRKINNKSKRMLEIEDEYSVEIEELLRWAYVDQNYSTKEIGIYLNVQRNVVSKWLRKAGISRRRVRLDEV